MRTQTGTPRRLDRRTGLQLVAWGLLVWAAVAVFLRLFGHVLLYPTRPLVVAGFFVAVVPLMAMVTYPVYRVLGLGAPSRPAAAVVLATPGMVLDVGLVLLAADLVFPTMTSETVVNLGAILLFGYAVVLLTGLVPRRSAWLPE